MNFSIIGLTMTLSSGHCKIHGQGVILRPTCDDDLDLLAAWFADPNFVIWWGGAPKSRAEVAQKYLGHDPSRQAFVVEAQSEPIGYIQSWCDDPPDGGIDIVLKTEAQGQRLGVEAVRALASYLRKAGWRRITIDPLRKNQRAIKPFEKAGFVQERSEGDH